MKPGAAPPLPPGFEEVEAPPLPPGFEEGVAPETPAATEDSGGLDADALLAGFGQGASYNTTDEGSGLANAAMALGVNLGEKLSQTDLYRNIYRTVSPPAREMTNAEMDAQGRGDAAEVRRLFGLKPGLVDTYRAQRDEERKHLDEAKARSPVQYGGAELAGALAAPGPSLGKGARAADFAKLGAKMGAGYGFGGSKQEGLGAALDSLYGAGTGAAGGAILGPLAQKAGDKLGDFARRQATRALNPTARDMVRLANSGLAESMPQDLLESGVIRPFASVEGTAARVGGALQQRGQALGGVIDAIDAAAGGKVVHPSHFAQEVESTIVAPHRAQSSEMAQAIADKAQREADLARKLYDKPGQGAMSLKDAERLLKQPHSEEAHALANTVGTPPDRVKAAAAVYSAARKVNEDAAEAAAKSLAPEMAGKFVPAKQAYGRMAAADEIVSRSAPKSVANRALSPSDYGFGIAAGQAYVPEGPLGPEQLLAAAKGVPAAVLHKILRERGNSTAAWAAHGLQKSRPLWETVAARAPAAAAGQGSEEEEDPGVLNSIRAFLRGG